MARFMVTAVGADRPGVVAALSGGLVALGCSLSDAQLAILQGYASMMLVVDAPATVDAGMLQSTLVLESEGLDQAFWVRRLAASPPPMWPGHRWVVSVHGADRPGVVFEVSRLLADSGINIVDLQSRLSGPTASLTMQVDVPTGVDGKEIEAKLDRLGEQLTLSCSMRPAVPDGH